MLWTGLATLLLAGGGMALGAEPAAAVDNFPCHRPQFYTHIRWVQTCPLWRGDVPVYAWPSPDAPVVGSLIEGGTANWFVGDTIGNAYSWGGMTNDWWAFTMADNGQWGWLPEVFFAGGDDFETDAGLYACNTGHRSGANYNACWDPNLDL